MTERTVLVADIGKSTTRIALVRAGVTGRTRAGSGIEGLTLPGGVDAAASHIIDLATDTAPAAVSVGVAGALGAPEAAATLARVLSDRYRAPACVTSDVITAHLGALAGDDGTIVVAGTGAVAVRIAPDGALRRADGLGPELGDHGSGYWIGRAGLRAGLRSNAATTLTVRADDHLEHEDAPRWLARQEQPIAAVARFARAVLDTAAEGDTTAQRICDDAIRALTATAVAVSDPDEIVCVLGGLAGHDWFRTRLIASLRAAGLAPHRPAGSAMDGALLAVDRTDLPHERLLHRAV